MKKKNRRRALVVCLIILIPILIATIVNHWVPDSVSLIFGVASGWAFRETLSPIPEGDKE